MFCYYTAFDTRWFSFSKFFFDRKFTIEQYMSLLSRGSIHQGHEGFSGQSRGKQCSFMSLSALLTAQTIPVIEWNSTTMFLVQGDNMYLNAFNNDLILREGFLSLNNLPTVSGCCRWSEDKSNNSSIETCRSVSRHNYIAR